MVNTKDSNRQSDLNSPVLNLRIKNRREGLDKDEVRRGIVIYRQGRYINKFGMDRQYNLLT